MRKVKVERSTGFDVLEPSVRPGNNSGRDKHGLFGKGNNFNARLGKTGQAYECHPTAVKLRETLLKCVTHEAMQAATERLLELTLDEDPKTAMKAIEILFDRILGKPRELVSVDNGSSTTDKWSQMDEASIRNHLKVYYDDNVIEVTEVDDNITTDNVTAESAINDNNQTKDDNQTKAS